MQFLLLMLYYFVKKKFFYHFNQKTSKGDQSKNVTDKAVKNVPGLCVTDQTNDDIRQGQFTYVMDPGMLMIPLLRTVTLTDLTQPH